MSQPFEYDSENSAGFYRRMAQRIAEVREKLRARYERLLPGRTLVIAEALEEAESAAWCTAFPHLFLPDFAELYLARITSAA